MLTQCFQYKNRLASLKTQLSDIEIEFEHIKIEQPLLQTIKTELDRKFHRKWDVAKTLEFNKLSSNIDFNKQLPFTTKLRLTILYGVFDFKAICNYGKILPTYVNHKFYELRINNTTTTIAELEN